ncbi:MAG: hypothetical protein DRH10_05860 [Deltaproteobacteria bacterium]|nr:MAG: hypothetical protein DRH10_05860 [Deltaproteobacteria bacterium]
MLFGGILIIIFDDICRKTCQAFPPPMLPFNWLAFPNKPDFGLKIALLRPPYLVQIIRISLQ